MGAGEMKVKGDSLFELFYGFGQKTRFAICPPKDNAELRPISELTDHAVKDLLGGSDLMLFEISKT